MDNIPDYDIEEINLKEYNPEIRKIILSNLKNYTKLITFKCNKCDLTDLPELPNTLIHFNWPSLLMIGVQGHGRHAVPCTESRPAGRKSTELSSVLRWVSRDDVSDC